MSAFRVIRRFRDLLDVNWGTFADDDVPQYDTATGKFVGVPMSGGGASTAAGVSVVDAGGYFTGADVEAALQELGADVGSLPDLSVILAPAASTRNVIQPTAGAVIAAIVKAHAAQSVDIFNVQKSDGGKYVRVGASGAVGIGSGSYDPAAYWIASKSAFVLSRSQYLDANGGPPLTLGATDTVIGAIFDIGAAATASGYDDYDGNAYGFYCSLSTPGAIQPAFSYGATYLSAAPLGSSGQMRESTGVSGLAYQSPSSAVNADLVQGVYGYANARGTGNFGRVIGVSAQGVVGGTAGAINEYVAAVLAEAQVWSASGSAIPELVALKASLQYFFARAVTVSKGLDVGNAGAATVVTSYGIYVAAQSGATNSYGLYVAGGKSVFVDPLLLGLAGAPADAVYANSQGSWYADAADALPKWKGKTSGGVVVTATPYVAGSTDVTVADGGTGSSTAAGARTNLDVPSNAEAVLDTLFDANTVLAADTDNTPAALTMGASTILARLAAGNIKAASVAEINALLGTIISGSAAGGDLAGTYPNPTLVTSKATGVRSFASGRYYGGPGIGVGGATTSLNQRIVFAPFEVSRSRAFNQLAVNVTVLGESGAKIRLGIYNDANGAPTSLVADAGQVAAGAGDGTGFKTASITQTLEGLYWLAFCTQAAPTTPPTCTQYENGIQIMMAWLVGCTSSSLAGTILTQDSVSGALPSTATPVATGSISVPCVWARAT